MKAFIQKLLREAISIDIEVGDIVLGGKFYNKKVVVKTLEKDENGWYLINGKPLFRYRKSTGEKEETKE